MRMLSTYVFGALLALLVGWCVNVNVIQPGFAKANAAVEAALR